MEFDPKKRGWLNMLLAIADFIVYVMDERQVRFKIYDVCLRRAKPVNRKAMRPIVGLRCPSQVIGEFT
jgi:hypothetical protein